MNEKRTKKRPARVKYHSRGSETIDRQHELLARYVRNNTEIKGQLFTSVRDIESFENIPALVQLYNDKLWFGHRQQSKLVIESGQIFINGYVTNTCAILSKLKELSASGIQNYSNSVEAWINGTNSGVDCEEKKNALMQMYSHSKVALIYGSAGTGKSTLIDHTAHFFADKRKLFLAQTNPAVDNLKRRVTAANCTFSTIAKYLRRDMSAEYDLLVIDESSTVSNEDMRKIIAKDMYYLYIIRRRIVN